MMVSRLICVVVCIRTSFPFPAKCDLSVRMWLYMYHLVYPFMSWWTVGLFLLNGYWASRCLEHPHVSFYVGVVFSSPGCVPGNRMAGLYGNAMLDWLKDRQTVLHSGCTILPSHQHDMQSLVSLHRHQHLFYYFHFLLIITILVGVKYISLWFWFALISLMTNNAKHVFVGLLDIFTFALKKCLFRSFACFKNWVVWLGCLSFISGL